MTKFKLSAHPKRNQKSAATQRQVRSGRDSHMRSSGEHAPASKTKLQYQGTINELRRLTWYADVRGRWEKCPKWCLALPLGMNWSSTRGTLWFDGPDPELLRRIMMEAIQASIYRR